MAMRSLFDFGVARVSARSNWRWIRDFDPGVLGAADAGVLELAGANRRGTRRRRTTCFHCACLLYRLIAGYRVFLVRVMQQKRLRKE